MSLCLDYRNIIREYILKNQKEIYFNTVYYYLIDFKDGRVLKYFNTKLDLTDYFQLVDASKNYINEYYNTFCKENLSEFNEEATVQKQDKLREMELSFLSQTDFSNEKINVSNLVTPYRYILISHVICGIELKNKQFIFDDQECLTYNIGDIKVDKSEYKVSHEIYADEYIVFLDEKYRFDCKTNVYTALKEQGKQGVQYE